ncbi:hypothetical protein P3L51_35045 [Streptomyces sp. PSRA5]|uniref:hypothetical protein n=1 Tax=Streptomyces panacea TaxID=3035064 RepID=UPI00339BC629
MEAPVLAPAFAHGGTRLRVTTPRATTDKHDDAHRHVRTVTFAPPRIADAECEQAGSQAGRRRTAHWHRKARLPSLGYRETR